LARLRRDAASLNADLVTTWKDWVRLPPPDRAGITPLGVTLAWTDSAALHAMILDVFTERR
jgi:tetraacyldisaccharide-1-P 4'-kinase